MEQVHTARCWGAIFPLGGELYDEPSSGGSFIPLPFFPFTFSKNTDAQNDMLEDLYEDRLSNLKESLSDYYQEEIEVCGKEVLENVSRAEVYLLSFRDVPHHLQRFEVQQ